MHVYNNVVTYMYTRMHQGIVMVHVSTYKPMNGLQYWALILHVMCTVSACLVHILNYLVKG